MGPVIIDHEKTMALGIITPVHPIMPQANSGGNGGEYEPWPMPDDGEGDEFNRTPALSGDTYRPADRPTGPGKDKPQPPWSAPRPALSSHGERAEKVAEMVKRWEYRFPTRRRVPAENMHGNPSPLHLSKKAEGSTPPGPTPPDDKPAPKDDQKEGVVLAANGDTGTHALPAVEKLTGKPSATPLAHRTARHVQTVFRDAGWDILVWYGEHTREFWVMDSDGLHGGFKSATDMYQGMGWSEIPGEGVVKL